MIDANCTGISEPAAYDEYVQRDFLANSRALAVTNSPLHAPIPDEPGHGRLSLQLGAIPPLGCARRFVQGHTATVDANKSPVAPKLALGATLNAVKGFIPYAGMVYLPPIPFAGARSSIVGGEVGVAHALGERFAVAVRVHAQLQRTTADIATADAATDPAFDDLFTASTFGLGANFGLADGPVRPYAALGFTDVSTFFYVGDDLTVNANLHPYFGPDLSVGVDGAPGESRFRWSAEVYWAPGGKSSPEGRPAYVGTEPGFGRYGHVLTARASAGIAL